jgi:DNA-binding CsgD family transcriptional regulator
MQKPNKMIPVMAEVGLVFLDLSLKLIAYDRGAAEILDCPAQPLPPAILDLLGGRTVSDLSPLKTQLRLGAIEYLCRAYMIDSYSGWITEPMVAVQLERVSSASDAVDKIGIKYNLTDRELEALRGISMGLTSKELAERMSISPNTVKAFLRLIMIKMGVTTRGGIVANILNRASVEDASEMPVIEAPLSEQPDLRAF